jgi:hypothetical protein
MGAVQSRLFQLTATTPGTDVEKQHLRISSAYASESTGGRANDVVAGLITAKASIMACASSLNSFDVSGKYVPQFARIVMATHCCEVFLFCSIGLGPQHLRLPPA